MINFSNVESFRIPEGNVSVIYHADRVLWRKPVAGYKVELPYIESSGSQYIDTGVVGGDGITSEMSVWRTSTATNECFCGAYDGTHRLWLTYTFGNSWYRGYNGSAGAMCPSTPIANWTNIKTSLIDDKINYNIDGVDYSARYEAGFTCSNNVFIFAMGTHKGPNYYSKGRISYCKIYDHDNLVRDFIPVLDSKDVPCMYDKVSGELFYNKGSGSFKVPKYKRQLDYLESTGTQYIDTGVTINTATDTVELVFQNLESTVYKWFFGEHDSNARFALGSGDGTNKRNVAYGAATYKVKDTQMYDTKHTFVANEEGVFLDSVKIAGFSSFASTSTLYLFNLNLNSGDYKAKAKIWRYKHTRNGTLVHDFIPVLDFNDVLCMYDIVSDKLLYNVGSGEFKTN